MKKCRSDSVRESLLSALAAPTIQQGVSKPLGELYNSRVCDVNSAARKP